MSEEEEPDHDNIEKEFVEHEIFLSDKSNKFLEKEVRLAKERGLDINEEDIINLALLHLMDEKENWSTEKFKEELEKTLKFSKRLKEYDKKKKNKT